MKTVKTVFLLLACFAFLTPVLWAQQKVTISLGMHVANVKDQETATWNIVQAFMADNPGITVDISGADTDEHVKKMKMAAQSGTLPDIFWMLPAPAREMEQAGYLLDLKDMLAQNPDLNSRIADSMKKASFVDGVQYGLPYQTLITGLWYNKGLFRKYGVKEPVAGTTFDQLTAMIKTFKKNGVMTIAQGAKDPFSVWAFLIGWERYGYFNRIDAILAGKDKFDNPDFLNYFQKIDQMRSLGAFPTNITTMNYFQSVDMFLNGKSAMLDAGIWEAGKVAKALGKDTGFWWGPTFADGVGNQKVLMRAPTAPLVVSAKVAKYEAKEAAIYKFFAFYYSNKAAQIMIDAGIAPVVNYKGRVDRDKNIGFATVLDALNLPGWVTPYAQPDLVVAEPVQNAMYDSLYGVMNGTYTPKKALDLIDQAVERQ